MGDGAGGDGGGVGGEGVGGAGWGGGGGGVGGNGDGEGAVPPQSATKRSPTGVRRPSVGSNNAEDHISFLCGV